MCGLSQIKVGDYIPEHTAPFFVPANGALT